MCCLQFEAIGDAIGFDWTTLIDEMEWNEMEWAIKLNDYISSKTQYAREKCRNCNVAMQVRQYRQIVGLGLDLVCDYCKVGLETDEGSSWLIGGAELIHCLVVG